jgi:hypothetical protein
MKQCDSLKLLHSSIATIMIVPDPESRHLFIFPYSMIPNTRAPWAQAIVLNSLQKGIRLFARCQHDGKTGREGAAHEGWHAGPDWLPGPTTDR